MSLRTPALVKHFSLMQLVSRSSTAQACQDISYRAEQDGWQAECCESGLCQPRTLVQADVYCLSWRLLGPSEISVNAAAEMAAQSTPQGKGEAKGGEAPGFRSAPEHEGLGQTQAGQIARHAQECARRRA